MRFGLIVGLGIIAVASLAAADPPRVVMGHPTHAFEAGRLDADRDGWITRAEASAEAERMFGELDSNNDGKLDGQDRARHHGRMFQHRIERRAEHGERDVVIMHHREEGAPGAPETRPGVHAEVASLRPHVPMFAMFIHSSEESDRNGDGALSREEFRAQHLRFFDAGDGNGDGRIRFELPSLPEPPEPPEPPQAPTPPQPPTPPGH